MWYQVKCHLILDWKGLPGRKSCKLKISHLAFQVSSLFFPSCPSMDCIKDAALRLLGLWLGYWKGTKGRGSIILGS